MKKVLLILLCLIIFFCIGCSKDNTPPVNNDPYSFATAITNGDVISTDLGRTTRIEILEKFIENIKNESTDTIRITQYTIDGEAILTDLVYDGKKINYTNDTTRDSHGKRTVENKTFDSIYKEGNSYHLKNSSEDIVICSDN